MLNKVGKTIMIDLKLMSLQLEIYFCSFGDCYKNIVEYHDSKIYIQLTSVDYAELIISLDGTAKLRKYFFRPEISALNRLSADFNEIAECDGIESVLATNVKKIEQVKTIYTKINWIFSAT